MKDTGIGIHYPVAEPDSIFALQMYSYTENISILCALSPWSTWTLLSFNEKWIFYTASQQPLQDPGCTHFHTYLFGVQNMPVWFCTQYTQVNTTLHSLCYGYLFCFILFFLQQK